MRSLLAACHFALRTPHSALRRLPPRSPTAPPVSTPFASWFPGCGRAAGPRADPSAGRGRAPAARSGCSRGVAPERGRAGWERDTRPRAPAPRGGPWPQRGPRRCGAGLRISAHARRRGRRRRARLRSGRPAAPRASRRTTDKARSAAPAGRSAGTTAAGRGASGGGRCRTPRGGMWERKTARGTRGTRPAGAAARALHAPSARCTAARITSSGAAWPGKKRAKAAAPWCTSTSRPSCARTPAARSIRTQRVLPGV